MPEYIVKTAAFTTEEGESVSRSLFISADYFESSDQGNYEFYERGEEGKSRILVASVPQRNVFAVMEFDEAYHSDLLYALDGPEEGEEDPEDTCLDCRFKELLDSEEFFNAVCAAYDTIQEADAEALETAAVEYRKFQGDPRWGIVSEGRFIPFTGSEEYVKGVLGRNDIESLRFFQGDPTQDCPLVVN